MVKGKVTGIIANLVTIEAFGPVGQNEICYIKVGDEDLMAEVIKIIGNIAQTHRWQFINSNQHFLFLGLPHLIA